MSTGIFQDVNAMFAIKLNREVSVGVFILISKEDVRNFYINAVDIYSDHC